MSSGRYARVSRLTPRARDLIWIGVNATFHSAAVLEIGSNIGGLNTLDGVMADVAIWKGYALTNAEIASLAAGLPLQRSGIVSYWNLDEAGGTRVDGIGTNNLTDNNTVLSGAGVVGNAADFERDNVEYLSIVDASQSGLDITDDISIFHWFKMEVFPGNAMVITDKFLNNNGYSTFINSSQKLNGTQDGTAVASNTTIQPGVFYHLGTTYDSAAYKAWVNSDNESTTATSDSSISTDQDFIIGVNTLLNDPLDGLLDEVIVAKRYFREEEIKTLYIKGLNGKPATSSEKQIGPPIINTQPVSQTALIGDNVTLLVTATATPSPISYQWKKDNIDIAGATGSVLSLTNVLLSDSGNYTVIVGNSQGSVTSNVATLTVNAPTIDDVLSRPFRPEDIPGGLVGYWKLDEVAGVRADSSGNNNNLTENPTVGSIAEDYWSTGENSADFENDSTEYLSITDAAQTGLDISGASGVFSFSAWVKFESMGATQYLAGKGGTNLQLLLVSTNKMRLFSSGTELTGITTISAGRWYHFGFVYDKGNSIQSIYIDGNLEISDTSPGTLQDNSMERSINTNPN